MRRIEDYLTIDETSRTGLRWLRKHGRASAGKEAFTTLTPDGYYQGSFYGAKYAHQVVMFLSTGKWSDRTLFIDHIDGNRTNNNVDNLRFVSPVENSLNRKVQSNSSSGIRNIRRKVFVRKDGSERVRFNVFYRKKDYGLFNTVEEAQQKLKLIQSNDIDYL